MKRLNLLTRQIEEWLGKSRLKHFNVAIEKAKKTLAEKIKQQKNNGNPKYGVASSTARKKISRNLKKVHSSVLLIVAILSLTSVVGYRFYNHPSLAVDTISPRTIIAPRSDRFEDVKTTREKRQAIRTGVVPILKLDRKITKQMEGKIGAYLNEIEQLRKLTGSFPFVDVKILSLPTQRYLRSSQDWEWQTILAAVAHSEEVNPDEPGFWSEKNKKQLKREIQQATSELQNYRQRSSEDAYESLQVKITQARQGYGLAQTRLTQEQISNSEIENKILLLNLPDSSWNQSKRGILVAGERIFNQGIARGLPDDIIKNAVEKNLNNLVPAVTEPVAANLLISVIEPNLTEDIEATQRKAQQAAEGVPPVFVSIEKGEEIVTAGEKITQEDFVLLDNFGLSGRTIKWEGLGISGIVVSAVVFIFLLIERRVYGSLMRRRDRILLCLLSLSVPLLVILGFRYTSLPAVGLLVSSFYSPALGITQVSLLTGLMCFSAASSTSFGWDYAIAGAVGGLVAAAMAGRLRSREELAILGGAVGLTQTGVYLIVNLIISPAPLTIWYLVLTPAIICGFSGLAWCTIALGISPYLERLFDLVTPIRLAELSNPNRPLLKRLATEAPGTFQHTMFVASLAEAAARELHCNVELVRAGTLYHDIGKMHDPLGFIENQMGGPNKHDIINDPYISTEIIRKHVTEGLVMARKYGLPKAIRDFIPEHQGTLLISYFYYQAKQQAETAAETLPQEYDFRYDGPVPQSRETGIVMLADGCEAALRSLKDATPEKALNMVNKIFRARLQDGQLADCGLKREEFPIIAEVFVNVWQQSNHKRIAYPKAALDASKTSKIGIGDGSSTRDNLTKPKQNNGKN